MSKTSSQAVDDAMEKVDAVIKEVMTTPHVLTPSEALELFDELRILLDVRERTVLDGVKRSGGE